MFAGDEVLTFLCLGLVQFVQDGGKVRQREGARGYCLDTFLSTRANDVRELTAAELDIVRVLCGLCGSDPTPGWCSCEVYILSLNESGLLTREKDRDARNPAEDFVHKEILRAAMFLERQLI